MDRDFEELMSNTWARTGHNFVVGAFLAAEARYAAVSAALIEGLESGVLEGAELAEVDRELYDADVMLDRARADVLNLGIDPDNLPEEYL